MEKFYEGDKVNFWIGSDKYVGKIISHLKTLERYIIKPENSSNSIVIHESDVRGACLLEKDNPNNTFLMERSRTTDRS